MDGEAGARPDTSRLYAGLIAIASGAHALYAALVGGAMGAMDDARMTFMLALGSVVLVHGFVLFTPVALAPRVMRVSGPLMIVYGFLMLLGELVRLAFPPAGMPGAVAMDAGMATFGALMLASGTVMTAERVRAMLR